MRSLDEWLAHQSRVHPQTIDLGLARPRQVLERLGWRQPTVPVITIAGTNGKGSVTAYCTSILEAAGWNVGVFTSPHLRDYRERVRIAGRRVTADELVWAFETIEAARADISLTFFEYNALAAFLLFEKAGVEAWILEVGLGGRLDAANLVDPTVAVVVSIGFDHQEYLGNTLDAIAVEKAGIFRQGRAAVLGSREMPPALAACAAALGAPLKRLGIEFDVERRSGGWRYRGTLWDLSALPPPALLGATQFANAATALAAIEEIHAVLPVGAPAIARGLQTVCLTGRFQLIVPRRPGPRWILDVAHNPAAARVLAENLRDLPIPGRTFAVCGILGDKDAAGVAAELHGCFAAWWLASTDGARGTSGAVLAERIATQAGAPLSTRESIAEACAAALAVATPEDLIVVFGSFHTVGPALDWLESQGVILEDSADA